MLNQQFTQESATIQAVKKISPAVVNIIVTKHLEEIQKQFAFPFGPNSFGVPFSPNQIPPEALDEKGDVKIGGGSGFIISDDGIILTNKHVVSEREGEYTAILGEDKKYSAKVLARDPINDVAIVKIEEKNLTAIELGDSSGLELGQSVIAIGNALGEFQNTVSTGIVSGLSRHITAQSGISGQQESLRGLIQTDAAINPGNSGGPLVNLEGKAIGINAAIVFGAQNIGFAIPINNAKKAIEELKKYGRIRQPFLGLRYVILNAGLQKQNNLPVNYGALIVKERGHDAFAVIPGSSAEKAGVKENDIILECNDKKIDNQNTLQDAISKLNIGDMLKLKVLRENQEKMLETMLEERR